MGAPGLATPCCGSSGVRGLIITTWLPSNCHADGLYGNMSSTNEFHNALIAYVLYRLVHVLSFNNTTFEDTAKTTQLSQLLFTCRISLETYKNPDWRYLPICQSFLGQLLSNSDLLLHALPALRQTVQPRVLLGVLQQTSHTSTINTN